MSVFDIITLFGGLALFLFGMNLMGSALEKLAGGRLKLVLRNMTSTPLRGFLLGTAVTAVIQSSSATTVMLVGFVNSGLMSLEQSAGVTLGANLGAVATFWLLSLSGIHGTSVLVQLCKPKSFCIFNHHNRCIGDINSHFHYSCRNKNLDFSCCKSLHYPILFFGFHLSVKVLDPNVSRKNPFYLSCIIQDIFCIHALTFFHHGTDNICLTSFSDLFFYKSICFWSV